MWRKYCPARFSHTSPSLKEGWAQVQTWKLKANLCLMIRWQAGKKVDWPPCRCWHLVCVADKHWTLARFGSVSGSNCLTSNKRIEFFMDQWCSGGGGWGWVYTCSCAVILWHISHFTRHSKSSLHTCAHTHKSSKLALHSLSLSRWLISLGQKTGQFYQLGH